jgi:hypothetical protein
MTKAFQWLETRLDEGGWIRRAYLVLVTAMTWKVVIWAMSYADKNAAKSGSDIALVIGAVSAVVAAVQTFAFKNYLESRK